MGAVVGVGKVGNHPEDKRRKVSRRETFGRKGQKITPRHKGGCTLAPREFSRGCRGDPCGRPRSILSILSISSIPSISRGHPPHPPLRLWKRPRGQGAPAQSPRDDSRFRTLELLFQALFISCLFLVESLLHDCQFPDVYQHGQFSAFTCFQPLTRSPT